MISLFGAPTLLLGLLGIAGVLYLLQRLRVRHRPVQVVSTLFWRAAVEEARARVLVERFRHPLVYLFLLAICALLWLAAGGIDTPDRDGERHVIVIDGSHQAGGAERFAATLARVEEAIADLPRARRQVLFAGGVPRTLLAPGEPDRLFSERCRGLAPELTPSQLDATVLGLLPALAGNEATTLWIAADASLAPELIAELPASVTVGALRPEGAPSAAAPRIVACGVSPGASGNWEEVDLLVEVAGESPLDEVTLAASLAGAPITEGVTRRAFDGRVQFSFAGLPASGGRFEAALSSGSERIEPAVARILPLRRTLKVLLDPTLAPWLSPVLEADPALRVVETSADVVVRRSGSGLGSGLPALEFVTRNAQEESILLTHAGDQSSADVLEHALIDLGLDQVDAMELAEAAGRPITLGARPAEGRSIGVWEELLAEEYNFVSSRSFPLFVALSLRWILEVPDFPAEIAAGRPWVDPTSGEPAALRFVAGDVSGGGGGVGELEQVWDPVGAPLSPPWAGTYLDPRGNSVEVTLLGAVTPRATSALESDAVAPPGGTSPLATWLALIVLGLLGAEWYFHRRGELP